MAMESAEVPKEAIYYLVGVDKARFKRPVVPGDQLRFDVEGDDNWDGDFQAMNGVDLIEVGYYGDLRHYFSSNRARSSFRWTGQGRHCDEITGWLVVDSVTYVVDALTAIELRFQQH